MAEPVFEEYSKIARLSRQCVITEKIDGTNGCIYIADDLQPFELLAGRKVPFMVGSRTRWIFPEADNFGFARWAYEHEAELLKLGPGRHFGEWWGSGIQRGYGLKNGEKRFSLFNVFRWRQPGQPLEHDKQTHAPECCSVVPRLAAGMFDSALCAEVIADLRSNGSVASLGFMRPEGIVVWHEAAKVLFKKTLEGDESLKGGK